MDKQTNSNKETPDGKKNLNLYNAVQICPPEAQRPISSGRLTGKTDINPMWRIKAITEALGPCGVGWKYEITRQWTEVYGAEVKCFTNINLYIRYAGEWSEPIPGTGGSSLVSVEKKGPYVSDEAYKMALTDALSVAMKALGMAANIYFAKDYVYDTKYSSSAQNAYNHPQQPTPAPAQTDVFSQIESAQNLDTLKVIWGNNPNLHHDRSFTEAVTARKNVLIGNNKQ